MARQKTHTFDRDGCIVHYGFRIRQRTLKDSTAYVLDLKTLHGRRTRKQFTTLVEAKRHAEQMHVLKETHGVAALTLTDRDRRDAVEALHMLKGTGLRLTDVVRDYVRKHRPADDAVTVSALTDAFLAWMAETDRKLSANSAGKYRETTIRDVTAKLRGFMDAFGSDPAVTVGQADMAEWLDGQDFGPKAWDNHRRAVSMLYSWALRDGKLPPDAVNPATGLKPPAEASHLPAIFDVGTVTNILAFLAKNTPQAVPYFAAGFFSGIRPDELRRTPFSAVDFDTGEIHIAAEASKTHAERLVSIPDNLAAWLKAYTPRDRTKPLGASYATLARWRKEIVEHIGTAWPKDVARHCFATYYTALHGMDAAAEQLGHRSTKMLHDHYKGLVRNRRDAAQRYFAIRPTSGDKA